jgi:hypothetical protein
MEYSRWANSFFYARALTGSPEIDASQLFIHPREGDAKTMSYATLANVDANWVALNFPHTPMDYIHELLEIIKRFRHDMERSVYRYRGFKVPIW